MPGDPRRTVPMAAPVESAIAPIETRSLGNLGRYELLSLLAKGGMGEVYLARARGLGGFEKLVVIKRNLPSLAMETEPLFAEARLVATLQHTNIVQVNDVDTDGPTVFIAMEFLHGQDVRSLVKRTWGAGEKLPLDHAIAIALATCAGLHYAHEKRDADGTPLELVHRDVSPSNVFVTYDGGVKLIDFGIAKATTLPSETQLGTIKGKPGYMSPEQCRGEPLDRRTDVFSVGIMLYEMTLGRRPFVGDNEYLLYREICEGTPRAPRELDASYPPALEAIVMRALAKDRRARFATADELQHALAKLASDARLDVSQWSLAGFMARVYRAELDAWREAQRTGESLIEHVIKKTTASVPAIEPRDAPKPVTDATTAADTKPPKPKRAGLYVLAGAAIAIGITAIVAARARDKEETPSPPPAAATTITPKPTVEAPPPSTEPAPVEPKPVETLVAEPDKPKRSTGRRRARTPSPTPGSGSPSTVPPTPPTVPGPDDPIN